MRILYDFFPVFIFFIVYHLWGIYVATAAAMVASLLQVMIHRYYFKQFDGMQILTLLIIILLGGASILLHDEIFIKLKPTVINWIFALVFGLSQFIGDKVMIERMMGAKLSLPKDIWRAANLSWISFFILMGTANLYVIFNFSTDVWVDFKLYGMFGLTCIFMLVQAVSLVRYIPLEEWNKLQEKIERWRF